MSLPDQITAYLQLPFRVCDAGLAASLAEAGQRRLIFTMGRSAGHYSIANCLYPTTALVAGQHLHELGAELPLLELPEFDHLAGFYDEHGLEPMSREELLVEQAGGKLRAAWQLLAGVPAVRDSLRPLVRTIQVLRSSDPEIDVSYSHPAVPFSVFVSVGEDCSLVAALRVAESLLHEAMHLKLTLLEAEVELVWAGSQEVYYSPWRDENRPIRGVLHGLFVFAAVREFYMALLESAVMPQEKKFIQDRLAGIAKEFMAVQQFSGTPGLTRAGRQLAISLLAHCDSADKH